MTREFFININQQCNELSWFQNILHPLITVFPQKKAAGSFEVQMAGTVSLKFPTLIALAQTEFPPDYVRGDVEFFGGRFMHGKHTTWT